MSTLHQKRKQPRIPALTGRPDFEQILLVLQGGGALGAYQAGVYEALAERDLHPDWVTGISIGAINAALIAGNAPEARVDKLRAFWETVTQGHPWSGMAGELNPWGQAMRGVVNRMSAGAALMTGVPGMFAPRWQPPWLAPWPNWEPYDTRPLKQTLERLVDFDRINSAETRFSAGAVNICTGRLVYFDAGAIKIRPEHVMASGALPPALPAVEIDGEHYWDGGIVSNSPLQWLVRDHGRRDTLAIQVDLWSAQGRNPRNPIEAMTRHKEIRFASRTRDNADRFRAEQKLRNALAEFLAKLPEELKTGPEAAILEQAADRKVASLVHLAYRSQEHESDSKDYEFSRLSMEDHWRSGHEAASQALDRPGALDRPDNTEGVAFHGLFDELERSAS
jgi:NTE family protein